MIKKNIKIKLCLITSMFFLHSSFPLFAMEEDPKEQLISMIKLKKEKLEKKEKKAEELKKEVEDLEALFNKVLILKNDQEPTTPAPAPVLKPVPNPVVLKKKTPLQQEPSYPTTPKGKAIQSLQGISISPDKRVNISTVEKIDEELKRNGFTQPERIEIFSPGIDVRTNAANIRKSILEGTRKDSPPEKCIENFLTWKDK